MIIPVDPIYFEYGLDCLTCFAPDKTPSIIYAGFSGIKHGTHWLPGDPNLPNYIFRMYQYEACRWQGMIGGMRATYTIQSSLTRLTITKSIHYYVFYADPTNTCVINFQNQIGIGANEKFYGGEAAVFWLEPPEPESIAELSDLFGIPKNDQTTVLVYPVPTNEQVAKLQNFTAQIKISIKREFP